MALRPMLAVAREEACIISSELAVSARASVKEGVAGSVRMAEKEAMNPIGVRAMVESSVKEGLGESSLLHARPNLPNTLQPNTLLTEHLSLQSSSSASSASAVTRAIETDLNTTLRETISNATQTGAEEQMDQIVEVAKGVVEGRVALPEIV